MKDGLQACNDDRGVLVHEASLTSIGESESECPVEADFRVRGTENVVSQLSSSVAHSTDTTQQYVTGSGILLAAGSWNPTLTICAFA